MLKPFSSYLLSNLSLVYPVSQLCYIVWPSLTTATNNNPYEENTDTTYRRIIEQAIAELPAQRQKVYLLSRDEGLKQTEIAARMAISLETVKKHMVLALRSIRNYAMAHPEMHLLLLVFLLC